MSQSLLATLSLTTLILLAPDLGASSRLAQDPAPADQKQEKPAKQTPMDRLKAARKARQPKAADILRKDGSVVKPGEIPAQADSTSRATWASVMDSLSNGDAINSFELQFHLRQRPPETVQSNDMTLNFAYLAPKYVSARMESGRTLLRGDQGDYLIDSDGVLRLQGREAKADQKQLDQMAAIAASFIALTDPSSLRLVDLAMLDSRPKTLHPSLHAEAKELLWIRVTSPDFFLFREDASGADPTYQADLAINAETKTIRFAVIRETTPPEGMTPSTIFVALSKHHRRDGLLVPHRIEIFDIDRDVSPARFYKRATSRLDLKKDLGRLRPRLRPSDFDRPSK